MFTLYLLWKLTLTPKWKWSFKIKRVQTFSCLWSITEQTSSYVHSIGKSDVMGKVTALDSWWNGTDLSRSTRYASTNYSTADNHEYVY